MESKSGNLQSLLAMAVALMALFISVWQGCEQRKHNRYSVRPLLTFDQNSYNNTKAIRLSNNGLGPALIKRFIVKIDGKELDAEMGNPWTIVIKKRDIKKVSGMYYLSDGANMKMEQTYSLLTWQPDTVAPLDISIHIDYWSIYEEIFSIEESF